jgi:hypothetical protein
MICKKFALLTLSILLSILAAAVSVQADTLYLNGVNGRVDLTGRVYITPYYGGLNNPNGMDSIFCVDPDHDSSLNTHWNVNVTLLGTDTDLSKTYLGMGPTAADARTRYEEAAWLLFNLSPPYGGPNMSLTDQQAIQAAVWWIISPGNTYGQFNDWARSAQAHYGEGNYSNVYILTDTNHQNQEFVSNVPVPEASTLLLLGTGLVLIWGVGKKERKRQIHSKPRNQIGA